MGSEAEDYEDLEHEHAEPEDGEPTINNNSDGKIQILIGPLAELVVNLKSIG